MMHRILFSLLLFTVVGCSATSTAPTPTPTPTPAPTPTAAPTVGIRLGGDLNFGSVAIGTSRDGVLTVNNPGTANLDVAGMSLVVDVPTPIALQSCMAMLVPLIPTRSIAVAPGETLTVGFRFTPTSGVNCSGRLVVDSNATFGGREFRVTAIGV
jgi:hypothetical protein